MGKTPSTVTLSSANNRSQMLVVYISLLSPSVLCTSCVCILCFLVLQNWGHCIPRIGLVAVPREPPTTGMLVSGLKPSSSGARFSCKFTPLYGSDLVAHSSPGLGPPGASSISWRHFVIHHICRVLQLEIQALFEIRSQRMM